MGSVEDNGSRSADLKMTMEHTTHEESVLLDIKSHSSQHQHKHNYYKRKAFAALFLGSYLLWLIIDLVTSPSIGDQATNTATFTLVKNEVASSSSATASSTGVLDVFQVYQPVLTPQGAVTETTMDNGIENTTLISQTAMVPSCQILLMNHSFAFSYGLPFVGNYTPPDCSYNRVTMNLTVTSQGRQYDRLALMYFNDTEVFRTSTAEPTTNGVEWTYIKDMSEYMYFWNSSQKLIFDLGNLVDSTYTASFNTTLTATFFTSQDRVEPASLVIPISARKGSSDAASVFTLPADNATNTVNFPRNANRAVFSISACGQATEEFWWSNVLQSDVDTFETVDGTLYGYSPFREVQLFIDGQLAGVQWPFPIIFTGGVVPGLWRPIVGIDAFDLREHEVDISPWLPVLCDGNDHTFEIRVAGILDDENGSGTLTETVGASWYVTGKIFVWQDAATSITTGKPPSIVHPEPIISITQSITQNATGANETLEYTINVSRQLSISSTITTQSGTQDIVWSQSLHSTNYGLYSDFGAVQQNNQSTQGTDVASGPVYYQSAYSYPLYANTTYIVQPSGNFTITAAIIRGLDISIFGSSVFPTGLQPFAYIPASEPLVSGFGGTHLSTTQNGSAFYFGSPSTGTSSGYGSTSQEFTFSGIDTTAGVPDKELYYRSVEAVNSTIVKDVEVLIGTEVTSFSSMPELMQIELNDVLLFAPKQVIGRGQGTVMQPLIQGGGV